MLTRYLPAMKSISYILVMVILGTILAGGCLQQNSNPPYLPPTQQSTLPTVVPTTTIIPKTTVITTPAPVYKTADLVLKSGTKPPIGFTLEYPSEWTYREERISWPSRASPVNEVTGQSTIRYWRDAYNFSSPDNQLYAHVYYDDVTGTGDYFYSLTSWADGVIRENTRSYCLDGAGNVLDVNSCSDQRTFYHAEAISNDPVTINGSFEARRLVFVSNDDANYGRYTVYLMHAGNMQGYNFTIPDHPEVAVEVYGPAWDFGRGGEAFAVDFRTSLNPVNATADIFSHLISSFTIT
jgi:hypothetical protein